MLAEEHRTFRLFWRKVLQVSASILLLLQTVWFPGTALAEDAFSFRGFNNENITTSTFALLMSGVSLDGTTIRVTDAKEGAAIGYVALDKGENAIMKSVELGGLEVHFSTTATVAEEGTGGAENDVPSVEIRFCSEADPDAVISKVTLKKPDNTVSGSVSLTSGASIPAGTRDIFMVMSGVNTKRRERQHRRLYRHEPSN